MATAILGAVTFGHLLNDLMQSMIPATYPILKESFHLSFAQVGMITLSNQVTASLLQPVVGSYTDRRPLAYSLSAGMAFTLVGMVLLAVATSLPLLMFAAALVGIGSSVFHPEASRIARLASGGRHGLAQSVFQVGGNLGSSLGPLMVRGIVLPHGQGAIGWFSLVALLAMVVLLRVGAWYGAVQRRAAAAPASAPRASGLSRSRVGWSLAILGVLVFSKYVYLASLTNYYTFYLMGHFHLGADSAQMHLFVFLAAVAAGTVLGGPIGDRIGRKRVIWASILGVAPFTLALPYANLLGTEVLVLVIGFVLASAFSAILVFAQELMPGRVGLISGLFFGLAFGVAGIGAAALGSLADHAGLDVVYRLCSFLPLIGVATAFLPSLERPRPA
jgi:FSR family fosmidomycin resistance protein-like MFS transporter